MSKGKIIHKVKGAKVHGSLSDKKNWLVYRKEKNYLNRRGISHVYNSSYIPTFTDLFE